MAAEKEDIKKLWQRKSLQELEALILGQKGLIGKEKNLAILHRLNSELKAMQEVYDQKLQESGRLAPKQTKTQDKPVLKSFDDYVKSKK